MSYWSRDQAFRLCALDHFDDRLGLHDHLRFIEEVEALHQQLMAAAFDIQHAKARAFFGGRRRFVMAFRHSLCVRAIGTRPRRRWKRQPLVDVVVGRQGLRGLELPASQVS